MFDSKCRIAVYGSDSFSRKVTEEIIKKRKNIVSLIISDNEMQYGTIESCSIEEAVRKEKKDYDIILIIEEMPLVEDKVFILYKFGITDIYILNKESREIFDTNGYISEMAIQHFNIENKPLMRYVEFHLVDFCNLKCKGCTHFANICHYESGNCVDINSLEKQLAKLSELCDVAMMRLMGGEPLLYNELKEAVKLTRKYFPKTRIFIVSNGLMIRKLGNEECEVIRNNEVYINISPYLITVQKYDEIDSFLNKKGIVHFWGNGENKLIKKQIIKKFHTCLSEIKREKNDRIKCYNEYCWFLREGLLSKCAYPLLIERLNQKYDSNFEILEQDYMDISKCHNGWEIIDFLNKTVPFCAYCRENIKEFVWECNVDSDALSDFIV